MRGQTTKAQLYLNDRHVGDISVRGWEGAWGMGDFEPNDAFAEFAPMYHRWSELMHGKGNEPLDQATSDELRKIENALYDVPARLLLVAAKQWREIAILNIDGAMVEWKER